MLLDAIWTTVFENMIFNTTQIIQGTSFGPSLHKKWLSKGNFWRSSLLSSQEKKQKEASLSGSISMSFLEKSCF
jgi:hypothetical protein